MSSKICFVTVGATASFESLINTVLTPEFASTLEKHNYTELLVQYGEGGLEHYEGAIKQSGVKDKTDLKISGFDLDKAGLGRYMRQAKGTTGAGKQTGQEGVVISHAGT